MTWMGHKRIDETMLYVHLAEQHRREIPGPILEAAAREASSWQRRGNARAEKTKNPPES